MTATATKRKRSDVDGGVPQVKVEARVVCASPPREGRLWRDARDTTCAQRYDDDDEPRYLRR